MKRAPVHARRELGLAALLLGFGLGLVLAFSSPAGAAPVQSGQVDCADPREAGIPECATTTTGDPGTSTTLGRVQPAIPARPTGAGGGLAFTGGDIAGVAAIGAGVAAGGVALAAVSRRQRSGRRNVADSAV
ncbi:MAG: hypothetical protein ACRD0A_15480 [Acidimicrobiales bacterium]